MFYENFQRLCAQHGKAETSVCRELGISSAAPKFWRDGAEPRASTVVKLAEYFGVDVSFFSKPFPEAPIDQPKFIPVHVITAEEDMVLRILSELPEKERNAVIMLIKELGK